jgi:hypothetical protein
MLKQVEVNLNLEKKITYFKEMGIVNTDETLRIAKRRAEELGMKTLLIASTYGHTAEKALELFGTGYNLIVVGGKREEFPDELRHSLVDRGHRVVFNSDYDFSYPEAAWEILRRFCEGMKVCVEMTLIATDLGMLAAGGEVIAVAGTGRYSFDQGGGADTAIIIEAVRSGDFFHFDVPALQSKKEGRRIKEILCKPR